MTEMSEYCVDTDTAFTVMPIKESKLPQEFMKGGFLLTSNAYGASSAKILSENSANNICPQLVYFKLIVY